MSDNMAKNCIFDFVIGWQYTSTTASANNKNRSDSVSRQQTQREKEKFCALLVEGIQQIPTSLIDALIIDLAFVWYGLFIGWRWSCSYWPPLTCKFILSGYSTHWIYASHNKLITLFNLLNGTFDLIILRLQVRNNVSNKEK